MPTKSREISLLLCLGALVLVLGSMYWARAVLMPIAVAILLTFLLSPVDSVLQRFGLGRVFSVILLTVLTFSLIGIMGWTLVVQLKGLANDLPNYEANIRKRVEDLQVGKLAQLGKVRAAIEHLLGDESASATSSEKTIQPVRVTMQGRNYSPVAWLQLLPPLLADILQVLLVVMLVIFMLLERDELRNRVIRLMGYGRLSLMTTALDDAGNRVGRYLFAQFIVNTSLGVMICMGLYILNVPYALLWGLLIVILRFIPYIGIWIVAILSFAVSLATSQNWWQPLSVLAIFAALETIVAMVVEPMLFSRNAGASRLALLIAIAFWTWLWGPVGLLLAMPFTACLSVVVKNVPQLEFIAVLFGDEPMMQSSVVYYKLLLAMEPDEAEGIVEEQLRTHSVEHVFEQVLVPSLYYTRRDSRLGKLTADEEAFIYKFTRQIVERIGLPSMYPVPSPDVTMNDSAAVSPRKIRILAWPVNGEGDAIALLMLQQLLDPTRYEMEICAAGRCLSEILHEVEQKMPGLFCIGFVPPGGLFACRHLSQLLRSRRSDLNIVVGHWGLHEKGHNDRETLLAAGASLVAASLVEARDQITQALHPHVKHQQEAAGNR